MSGATARVRVTIEVGPFGSWGDDCSVGQVKDQAAEDAGRLVLSLCRDASKKGITYRIMSKPVVTVVMVGEEVVS